MTTRIEVLGKSLIEWAVARNGEDDVLVRYLRDYVKPTYIMEAWRYDGLDSEASDDKVLVAFDVIERPSPYRNRCLLIVPLAEWDRAVAESPFITPLAEIEDDVAGSASPE